MKILLLLFSWISCAQIRYTYLPSRYDGAFESEFQVNHIDECSWQAIEKNKIGFRFITRGDKMFCAFLKVFRCFYKIVDRNMMDYILDTTASDDVCRVDSARNVSEFISGSCTVKGKDCAILEKIKKLCTFIGSDNAECISTKEYTVAHIECPSGEELIALRKETLHCCPRGEELKSVENGKAYCCPRGKQLKEVLRGKSICCDSSVSYHKGSGCCPTRELKYTTWRKLEYCCKEGNLPEEASSGVRGCCPTKKYFKEKNGYTYCCPAHNDFEPPNRCIPRK